MFKVRSLLFASIFIAATTAAFAQGAGNGGCVAGRATAPVKIEVFSDFQCPACRDFFLGTMRSVLTDYADPGKVCVVYREFPLTQHTYALPAARFGHAAQTLGPRYWAQVTEALYQSQDRWAASGNIEAELAKALNKDDLARLKKEASNPQIDGAITRDINLGKSMLVNQTPTFFVTAKGKTEKVAGVVQYPILKRFLDSLLGQ